MAREYFSRFQCAEPGCPEWTHYRSDTRAEQAETQRTYFGKWRCTRHTKPEELLTPSNTVRVYEVASDQRPHGVYWGPWGFVSGPGFKAFSKDFPPGTRLRVTAEILPPLPVCVSGHGPVSPSIGSTRQAAQSNGRPQNPFNTNPIKEGET